MAPAVWSAETEGGAESVHLRFGWVCVAVFTTIPQHLLKTVDSGVWLWGCESICTCLVFPAQVSDYPGRESELGGSRWPVRL